MVAVRSKGRHGCCAMIMACVVMILFICPFFLQGWHDNRAFAVGDSVYSDLATQAIRNNYSLYKDSGTGFNAFDAYILTEAGADLKTWTYKDTNLKDSMMSDVYNTINKPNEKITDDWSGQEVYVKTSKTIAYQYLAAKKWGKNEEAAKLLTILKNRQVAREDGAIDGNPFSDIPAFEALGRAGAIGEIETRKAINYLLANQDVDIPGETPHIGTGAWPSSWNDFMSTAQAVRALGYLKDYAGDQTDDVQTAINKGLAWMKSVQQADGSLQNGAYDDPATDTAEAVITLNLLGIGPGTWESETVKKTPIDYLRDGALNDDGTFGSYKNLMDNTWVLDAFLGLGADVSSSATIGIEITEENNSSSPLDSTQYVDFRAAAYKFDGTMSDISAVAEWSTADNGIAVVNDSGMVTGIGVGETAVSAKYDGVSNYIDVNITCVGLAVQAIRNNYSLYKDSGTGFNAFDAYILTEAGADLETWTYKDTNLKDSVMSNVYNTIDNPNEKTTDWSGQEVYAKTSKTIAYQYLAAKKWGKNGEAAQLLTILKDRQAPREDGAIDGNPFSDIPAFEALGRAGAIGEIETTKAINYLLANQDVDIPGETPHTGTGAWPSSWNDFMSTAQAVRTLNYLKDYAGNQTEAVQTAINKGLSWMESVQQADGSLQNGAYDDPATDTAEAVITLNLLGIEPGTWESETVKKTPIDYLRDGALNDDGTFGSYKNLMDNTWVLDAFLTLGSKISENTVLGIAVSPLNVDISVGETQQYTALADKLNGTTVNINNLAQWNTNNEEIASINNSGLIIGNGSGKTMVTAAGYGITGIAGITVISDEKGQDGGNNFSNETTVKVAVIGEDGELLFGPDSLEISEDDEYGLTALGALDATGLDWEFSDDDDGFVIEIDGQRNQGLNGWQFKVNNQVPSVLAGDKKVKNGDKIIWWYSTDPMSKGPDWDDLDSGNASSGVTAGSENVESIKSALKGYKDNLSGLTTNQLMNQDKIMTAERAAELQDVMAKNKVSLSMDAGQSESFLADEEVSLLIPEKALSQTTKIKVDEVPSSQQPKQFAVKFSSSVYEFGPSGTKFDQPVTMSIKVPLTEDMDFNKLSPAWYNEETKTWVPIPAVVDLETGLMVFQIDHFTKFAVIQLPDRKSFPDVGENMAWAKDAVEILAGKGFINGTGIGFEPKRSISRAEFVKMVVSVLKIEQKPYTEGLFKDVKEEEWFAGYVQSAYNHQIIKGDADGSFRPNDSISRNELAVILYRLQESVLASTQNVSLPFKDTAQIPKWAVNGVKFANQQDLMKGYGDGTFKGNKFLTRAEAAVTIYRYLGAMEE